MKLRFSGIGKFQVLENFSLNFAINSHNFRKLHQSSLKTSQKWNKNSNEEEKFSIFGRIKNRRISMENQKRGKSSRGSRKVENSRRIQQSSRRNRRGNQKHKFIWHTITLNDLVSLKAREEIKSKVMEKPTSILNPKVVEFKSKILPKRRINYADVDFIRHIYISHPHRLVEIVNRMVDEWPRVELSDMINFLLNEGFFVEYWNGEIKFR